MNVDIDTLVAVTEQLALRASPPIIAAAWRLLRFGSGLGTFSASQDRPFSSLLAKAVS